MHFRLLRYRINSLPVDRPGRYLYLRDMESGDYWSPSWQPTMKPLDRYECRHGLNVTRITGERSGISVETTYFVPLGRDYEVWRVRVHNPGSAPRLMRLFTYAEFSHHDAMLDIKAGWLPMCLNTTCRDDVVIFDPVVEAPSRLLTFFGADTHVHGYDCSLAAFVGPHRSESNPLAVETGACSNSDGVGESGLAGLCYELDMGPGEERVVTFVLGTAASRDHAKAIIRAATPASVVSNQLEEWRRYWADYRAGFQVETPDAEVNRVLNVWNPFQAKITFDWSRYISYYERGIERGFGFRDTMQDTMGVMHAIPGAAKEKIKLMLGIQYQAGNCKALLYPHTGKSEAGNRSDDQMWTIYAVCAYLKETGDFAFLEERVPYVDGGEGTVLDHMERGIAFTQRTVGDHGFPLFLRCDWNDSLAPVNFKNGKTETAFVFFQLGVGLREMATLYERLGAAEKATGAREQWERMRVRCAALWEGNWFARGFDCNGNLFGTSKNTYSKIFLNPQSWAVMSGLPSREHCIRALDSVRHHLNTDYGLQLLAPGAPFFDPEREGYFPMPAGSRENGGIFFHSNPWAIIAEVLNGRPGYAFEYYRKMLPSRRNEIADITLAEPYVFCQNMFGPQHPKFGGCNGSWLSGTAAWMFVAGSQYILGIRPDYDGLVVDPCLPAEWGEVKVIRRFRGITFSITIRNRTGKPGRVTRLSVAGRAVEGNRVSLGGIQEKMVVVDAEITGEWPACAG